MSAAATIEPGALPSAASLPTFFDNLDSFAEAPEGVAKLRELILDLAVRGMLVEQDEHEEPASELRETIRSKRNQFANEYAVRNGQTLSPVSCDEAPFELPANWE